jgi:hypothetical protein
MNCHPVGQAASGRYCQSSPFQRAGKYRRWQRDL